MLVLIPVALWLLMPAEAVAQNRFLLAASRSSQVVQNTRADADDLSRMTDLDMIDQFSEAGLLSAVPVSTRNYYLRSIPAQYRYLRPWSKLFLDRLSRQYYNRFKKKLRVTSLIRTVGRQLELARRNGNAARASGVRQSSHLTGATMDISKRFMSAAERQWMRGVLYSLKKQGYLYAIEEFRQPTFHIMIHRSYTGYVKRIEARSAQRVLRAAK